MRSRPAPLTLGLIIAVAVVALQALLVPLFAAPAAHAGPRDLPIVVAGPAAAVGQLVQQLDQQLPGAFDVTVAADATAADAVIRNRDAYGAIILGPDGPALHTATAASPTVAALLTQAAGTLAQGRAVPVTDVVALHDGDPRGSGFGAAFLPLAMTAMIAGVLMFLLVRARRARVVGLLTFAVGAGLGGAAVQMLWLDVLPGNYLANAGVMGLFALAVSATVVGLGSLVGQPGIGVGAVFVFLIGNALSGVTSAPELLPQPWGALGQLLPVGAGGTLLRSVAYFEGNGGAAAGWVLGAYAVVGLLLVALGRRAPVAATDADTADRPADREPAPAV